MTNKPGPKPKDEQAKKQTNFRMNTVSRQWLCDYCANRML